MISIQRSVACIAVLATLGAAAPAQAQLSQLGRMLPGGSTSNAAAVDPDAFLNETFETTRLMMISAYILAQASRTDVSRDEMRAHIAQLNSMSSSGEIDAQKAQFESDLAAVNANYANSDDVQARYNAASAEQQQMLLSAAYNFTLAMARNARLSQQGPELLQSIGRNPTMLRKAGSIRGAVAMIGMQVNAVRSMGDPLRTLMSRGGVEAPSDAEGTTPRTIEI